MGKCSILEKIFYPHTRTHISKRVPSWLLNGITTYRHVPRLYTIRNNQNGITYNLVKYGRAVFSSRAFHEPGPC